MQDWPKAITASRKQVVATRENYRSILASLCGLIDSVQRSIATSKSEEALQKLGQLKDGLNAAWETVLTDKTDQVVLLDAVESLVSSTNLLLNNDQNKSAYRTQEVYDDAVAAVIRYLDPNHNRNGRGLESQ